MSHKSVVAGALLFACGLAATLYAAEPDTSTPKATLKSCFALGLAGDLDAANKLFATPTTDEEKQLLAYGWTDDAYAPGLYAAVKAKFPDAKIPDWSHFADSLNKSIDAMEEKIEGDNATLSAPAATTQPAAGPIGKTVKLKKEANQWKLVIKDGGLLHLPPENLRPLAKARIDTIKTLIADTNAGKFTSFDEVRKEANTRMQAVMKTHAPTTAPATAPASQPTLVRPSS